MSAHSNCGSVSSYARGIGISANRKTVGVKINSRPLYERCNCHPMTAAELANVGGLFTWTHPDTDRRIEGPPKGALVPLRRGVCANCLAPGDAANATRPCSPTRERFL